MKTPAGNQSPWLRAALWMSAISWTVLILVLLLVNHFDTKREVESIALHEARVAFQRDLTYRFWNAERGGVHVAVSEAAPSNSYLTNLPNRDVTTATGQSLTLLNPTALTRMVHELVYNEFGLRGHVTSRKSMHASNAPDAWEAAALEKIERGQSEVSEAVLMEGVPHLRMMGRLLTEARCLKCHEQQGYREGDVRGGISVSVPLASPDLAALAASRRRLSVGLGGVWVLGLIGVVVAGRSVRGRLRERDQDMTERKRWEEMLRENRARLDLALQSARMGVWSRDMVENKRHFDDVVCHILGIEPATFTGTEAEFLSAVHPDDREGIRAALARTVEGDALYEPEYRAVWPDGSLHHINVRGRLSRDEKGRPLRLNGVLWDNTERVRADQTLRRSEADLAIAQAVGHVGSWISTPPEQGTLTWSDESYRIFGLSQGQFDGRVETFFRHVHPDDRGLLAEATRAAWRGERAYDLEHRIVRPDGHLRWVHEQARVERDAAGKPVRMIGVVQDITERKQAELERERLNRELDQRNRELQNVLYAASHDLRSPLLNIQGFSRRLDRACGELTKLHEQASGTSDAPALRIVRDQVPQALGFIRASVEKLDMLINGMLRLSRLGQVVLRPERLDLPRVLEQTVSALAIQIQAAGASVEVDPLPGCVGDSSLMNQVFTNLVENALKYRDPARPLRIHVTGRAEGGKVIICVTDNGSGIAPENMERIWELFARVNRSGASGEGLGLNLVRRILDRHAGRAWAESTLGEGSRFYVEWPGSC